MHLAIPARQAARGAARLGRMPLFLSVSSRTFSAPRSLDVPLPAPQKKERDARPGDAIASVDPAQARDAYSNAARQSETLFDRILAAAQQIARDADSELQHLTDRNESNLGRSFARLEQDLDERRLDAGAKRDFILARIASGTDQLRSRVVEQANRALGRMSALRKQFREALDPLRSATNGGLAALGKAFGDAYSSSNAAHFAIQRVGSDPENELAAEHEFSTGTDIAEAMLEAAAHYAPPYLDQDDEDLANRLDAVDKFVSPLLACVRCEIDVKFQALDGHAENLGVTGPRAIRSARDGALQSLDQTEQQLNLSVLDSHRQTVNSLAERNDQTRQSLIEQSEQATAGLRSDIGRSNRAHIDALTGVAATQPSALAMVHDEIDRAARASPTRAAALGLQASARLLRNIANVGDRHPSGVLGMAATNRANRLTRVDVGGLEQERLVRSFDRQQTQFIRDSFDEVAQSIEESLTSMEPMPGRVGTSCDSMVRSARRALETSKESLRDEVMGEGGFVQRLHDALDGLVPPPRRGSSSNPNSNREAPPSSLVCTAGDEPNASLFSPNPLMSVANAGPPMSLAPPTSAGPATNSSTTRPGGRADATQSAGKGPAPASCGACDAARERANGGSASQTSGQGRGDAGSGSPAAGGTSSQADVGVSSARTDLRSPRSYKEYCDGIAKNPLSAPATQSFIGQVKRNVPDHLIKKADAAKKALDAWGETDNGSLMKIALRGLTPKQGRALTEVFRSRNNGADLATEIRRHAYDSPFTAESTDTYNRNAALQALAGNAEEGAINELRAAFNYSNEVTRIMEIMQSLTEDQRRNLMAAHGAEIRELMTQLDDDQKAQFQLLMEGNTVRARSTELRSKIDDINRRFAYGQQRDERGRQLAGAISETEQARWNLEGAADRVDVFDLEHSRDRESRRSGHWREIQTDFGNLDGVADAIVRASPNAAVSRPDDPPGAALIAYATRPLEVYRVTSPMQREGETKEQALARQRDEYARWNVQLGDEQTGEYGAYRTATTSISEYQRLWIQMIVVKGSTSREARAAHTLAEFRRGDTKPPDYREIEAALHSGIADAREGGGFQHGSLEETERDRLQTFALAEQFRRQIEGGATGPVDATEAKASFRREMEAAYRNRPRDLDVALGVIDSDAGNMQAVIDQAIAREDPALLTRYLGRMDSKQIEDMVGEWNLRHPEGPGLRQRLGLNQYHWSITNMNGAVFTGDEANSLEIAMMGVPQNDLQRSEVALRVMNQQIEQSGWLGRLLAGDEYKRLVDNANQLKEAMGVSSAQIDELGRVRLTDSAGNRININFDADGQFHPARAGDSTNFEMILTSSRLVADNYVNAVDRIASILTTIIAIVGAIVLTIVTFGAGASVLVAMAVAAGFGALTIAVNASMRGGRYSRDDLTRDVVAAAIQVATAGLNVGIARGLAAGAKLGSAVESGAIAARSLSLGQRLAVTASRNALATAMLTQGAIGGMSNLASTALDPAMRRRDDYGDEVMHSFFRGFAGGAVTAGVAHGLNTGASSALQKFAARRAVAEALERGASREAATRLAAMTAAKMSGSSAMEVGLRAFVGATSATAGRATELGYENIVGTRHHGADEIYGELRQAFIQNAVQGVGEGMALRGTRAISSTHAEEHARQMESVRADAAKAAGEAFDLEMGRRGMGPQAQRGPESAAPPPTTATPDDAIRQASEETRTGSRPTETGSVAQVLRGGEPAAAPRMSRGEEPITRGGPGARMDEEIELPAMRLRTVGGPEDEGEITQRIKRVSLADLLVSTEPRPGPIFDRVDITPEMLRGGRSIPEHSMFRAVDDKDPVAAGRNYEALVLNDPHREVLLAHNPRTGEYMVIQGGEHSVSSPPEGWITERHSHPRLVSETLQERLTRALPSATGGDFVVLRSEVDHLAGTVPAHIPVTRSSVIDIDINGVRTETHFAITKLGDEYRLTVSFRPPHDGVDHLGPFNSIADYETKAHELTGVDFSHPTDRSVRTVQPEGRPRATIGEELTGEQRANVEAVVGSRAPPRAAEEAPAGRTLSLEEAQERVRAMGLVGEPDSMVRLFNILNDRTIPEASKAIFARAVLEATREWMISSGRLAEGDELMMFFHGAEGEQFESYRTRGIDMSLGPGSHANDDVGAGLYISQDYESARLYVAGGGAVVPFIAKRSDLGHVVDIRPGSPLRARWEAFFSANFGRFGSAFAASMLRRGGFRLPSGEPLPIGRGGFGTFTIEKSGRGLLMAAFLVELSNDPSLPAAIRDAAREPHLIMTDLGGPGTHGTDRGFITDQAAFKTQEIADLINRQMGFGRFSAANDNEPRATSLRSTSFIPEEQISPLSRMIGALLEDISGGSRDPEGHLAELMRLAPEATSAFFTEVARSGGAGPMVEETDSHLLRLTLEMRERGVPPDLVATMRSRFEEIADPNHPIYLRAAEAGEHAGFAAGLGDYLDRAFERRAALEAARKFGYSGATDKQRQLVRTARLKDPEALLRLITGDGSVHQLAARYARASANRGERYLKALTEGYALLRAVDPLRENWRSAGRALAQANRTESLIAMVRAEPEALLRLAHSNPQQLAELYADLVYKNVRDKVSEPITAERLGRYVGRRMVSNFLPIPGELSVVFNLREWGLNLLKSEPAQGGGANKPGFDIVGFTRINGSEVPPGFVRVLIADNKATQTDELQHVSAMFGERYVTNLRETATEIRSQIARIEANPVLAGRPEYQEFVAGARAAERQMRAAANKLANVPVPRLTDKPITARQRARLEAYGRAVAAIMAENGIDQVVTSRHGDVKELSSWLRKQNFLLEDEYLRRLDAMRTRW